MKRIITILLVLFIPLTALCESIDLHDMSMDDLQILDNRIATELSTRNAETGNRTDPIVVRPNEKSYLLNDGEFVVYFTGKVKDRTDSQDCRIDIVFENHSNIAVSLWEEADCKLNGWNLLSFMSLVVNKLGPGEKKVDSFTIEYDKAFLESPNEMEEYIWHLATRDEDDKFYKDLGTFVVHFDPSLWEQ